MDAYAPVVLVGAGPVGLTLALALARQGVRSILVDRAPGPSAHSKAPAIHARTLELLRGLGVADRLLAAGTFVRTLELHDASRRGRVLATIDLGELAAETAYPGLLVLEQGETERLLLDAVRATGRCEVRFGAEAVALDRGEDRARVTVREGERARVLEADYVVGCDGAGSFVRGALGLPFDGITYGLHAMLADVDVRDGRDALPWPRYAIGRGGLAFAVRLRPGRWRIVRVARGAPAAGAVGDDALRPWVEATLGRGPVETVWANRFRIHRRASPRFRVGRVLLAGDAAHVHSPIGGQGMNAGIGDAMNLAWKLAAALRGGDAGRLLASYERERRAVVVGSVTRFTDVLTRAYLQAPPALVRLGFAVLRAVLAIGPLRRRLLRRAAMLDLRAPASPLLERGARAAGRRLPDPVLRTPDGREVRLHALLASRPAIIEVAERRGFRDDLPVGVPVDVVRVGAGAWSDPGGVLRRLLGGTDGWILVRPDGVVAWARDRRDGLEEALAGALGAPPRARAGAGAAAAAAAAPPVSAPT